ncbi:GNAT family N-acetyltransferase [Candidatus Bipolaricaulota bacterium]|nr:GNAT family N-acetyltransferase [Candidatus Bipolaricaulota bacterium]
MSEPSIVIRPANPSHEEGAIFARFVDMAADGQFHILLGRRSAEILAKAFLVLNNDLSYEHTVFAEIDGTIVGMASGYTEEQHRRSSTQPLKQVAGELALRMRCMFVLASPILRFLHTYEEGDFYIQFLAVDQAYRGKGIGSALIQEMENRARSNRSEHLAIDVAARNTVARRLYEHLGFAVISQWPKIRWVRPNALRLTKPL